MLPLKDISDYHIMSGIEHKIKPNKIPMGISHCLPTFCYAKLLEIALDNDPLFSLCVACIKLGSCGGDRYGLVVGEKVIDVIGIVAL